MKITEKLVNYEYLKEDEAVKGARGVGEVLAKRIEELLTVGNVELHRDLWREERRRRC